MRTSNTAPAKPLTKTSLATTTDTVTCPLDGVDYIGLASVLSALECADQHRVTLDCIQVLRMEAPEVRTLMRFADQFARQVG